MKDNREISTRIFGLDFMRAAAITMVVSSHLLWIYPKNTSSLIYNTLTFLGFFGVEVFFVLSGFLIGNILFKTFVREKFTLVSVIYFLKRRWFRTLPTYFLVLVLNIALAFYFGYDTGDLWKYFFFLHNLFSTMPPFFTESWSLSVEEILYIILPIFLFFATSLIKIKSKSLVFLLSVLLLITISFGSKIIYQFTTQNTTIDQWNSSLKSVVIYRIDSILIGVLCSWFFFNKLVFWKKTKHILFCVGFVLLGFIFAGVGYFQLLIDKQPFFWNVIYLPFVSLTVACFLPVLSEWKKNDLKILSPITFISVISYSIYLLHYNIILQIMKHTILDKYGKIFDLYFFTLLYIFVTILLSYLLYRYFEKPIMNRRDK